MILWDTRASSYGLLPPRRFRGSSIFPCSNDESCGIFTMAAAAAISKFLLPL